ncbi:GtrA family protein [Marinobacterium weihaiense]|uniref:GtrA family protein n=1 Tax=Marinobacterium weihaiense TaxID=2851016 RepID=A0ABS6M7N6_9GAMM|nr:GtrA family protein [Marinobacterium weihaiense]MBV0932293.1 GtrA family protein [Marinobacterium weihaiense]
MIKHELGIVLRFGGVGGVATLVHLAVAWVALALYPQWSPLVANLVAFIAAFPVSFFGHRYLTFRTEGGAGRFLMLAAGGFCLNNGVLAVLITTLAVDGFVAIVLSTFTVPVLIYAGSRLWVFR